MSNVVEQDELAKEIEEEFDDFSKGYSSDQEKQWEQRMEQMNKVSQTMGSLLLAGWTMEKDICDKCNVRNLLSLSLYLSSSLLSNMFFLFTPRRHYSVKKTVQ